jgi:nicotinamidase-related amidase
MKALLVVDAQNEFSASGQRAVPNHERAVEAIGRHVRQARESATPIAWIQHHNRPTESPAFVPGSWGAQLSPGLGPQSGFGPERLFQKDVFGAFTGTDLEAWLRMQGVTEVLVAGFFTHMCVSTTAREALVRGFDVGIDYEATATREITHDLLGAQSAEEVRRTALLQLSSMGVTIHRSGIPTERESPLLAASGQVA